MSTASKIRTSKQNFAFSQFENVFQALCDDYDSCNELLIINDQTDNQNKQTNQMLAQISIKIITHHSIWFRNRKSYDIIK